MKIKSMILLLLFKIFLLGCNTNNTYNTMKGSKNNGSKSTPPGIDREAPFILVELNVKAKSFDSVIAVITITNNDSNDFSFYKPLLPFDGFTENVFGIFERNSYEPVKFKGHSQQKYMLVENSPTNYIIPVLKKDNFLLLKPHQSIKIEINVAQKYDFVEFKKKGFTEFKLIYWAFFPAVENQKQQMAMDSIDHIEKPIYYSVTVKESEDPDSMRVPFKVVLK